MGLIDLIRAAAAQQQAPAMQAPAMQAPAPAAQPAPFQQSSLPWQDQLLGAIDWQNAGGDAWNAIGREGVLGYMGDELQKKYGTRNLSDFRYVEDPSVPGGYRLDWQGQQTPTSGLVDAMRNRSLQTGLVNSGGVGASGDGLGGGFGMGNAADNLTFGATWEGEGGTDFNFYRKPDGSVGIKTGSQSSNDTADALTALAVVGGGMLGGQALGGLTGGAGAAGAAGADLGMAGFGQIGIPSSIPAGAGFGSLGTAGLPAVSTYGGSAIGGGLAGALSGGAAGAATSAMGAGSAPAGGGAFGEIGIPSSVPQGAGFNFTSQSGLPAVSTYGGTPIGSGAVGAGGVTSMGGSGGSGGLWDQVTSKVGDMGVSDWLGVGSTLLGGLAGGQGQQGSQSSTRAMDPRMDALFYGDLAPRTQGLLGGQQPVAQEAGNRMISTGYGLLGQTAPNTATNPYATGILDDLQRRQQEMISRGLQQTKGNFQAYGGLGGSRQGIAEADAITRGADQFTGQAANFMGGLYNQDQNRLRQDWTLGAGLMGQGLDTQFRPMQNTAQIFQPFTGYGTTTTSAEQGGGWQGALGGALGAAQFGKNMGWWGSK